MGFLDARRRRKDIARLEKEVESSPNPGTFLDLAELWIAEGEGEKAFEVAKRGAEMYPETERLVSFYRNIARTHLQATLGTLRRQIQEQPAPHLYGRLAQIYYEDLGDRTRALEIARHGLTEFPENEDLHMINGLIRLDRFLEDLLAHDGLKAGEHLEFSCASNPNNRKAAWSLARFYALIGANARARRILDGYLARVPDDEQAREFRRKVAQTAGDAGDEEIEPLLQELEDAGRFPASAVEYFPKSKTAATKLTSVPLDELRRRMGAGISRLEPLGGFRWACALDPSGKAIATKVVEGLGPEAVQTASARIHRNLEDSSKRMDLGSFLEGKVEGPESTLYLVEIRRHLLTLGISGKGHAAAALRAIDDYQDAVLQSTGSQTGSMPPAETPDGS